MKRTIFFWAFATLQSILTLIYLQGCGGGGGTGPIRIAKEQGIGRHNVYVGTDLSSKFTLAVGSIGGVSSWVTDQHGYMDCAYPGNQQLGVVSIVVGTPTSDVSSRSTMDYLPYSYLFLDVKGAIGGETVSIGVKTEQDPENNREPLYLVSNLTTSWQTYKIPLTKLVSEPSYPVSRFTHLYVVTELVFGTKIPETISFRSVQYKY